MIAAIIYILYTTLHQIYWQDIESKMTGMIRHKQGNKICSTVKERLHSEMEVSPMLRDILQLIVFFQFQLF